MQNCTLHGQFHISEALAPEPNEYSDIALAKNIKSHARKKKFLKNKSFLACYWAFFSNITLVIKRKFRTAFAKCTSVLQKYLKRDVWPNIFDNNSFVWVTESTSPNVFLLPIFSYSPLISEESEPH